MFDSSPYPTYVQSEQFKPYLSSGNKLFTQLENNVHSIWTLFL